MSFKSLMIECVYCNVAMTSSSTESRTNNPAGRGVRVGTSFTFAWMVPRNVVRSFCPVCSQLYRTSLRFWRSTGRFGCCLLKVNIDLVAGRQCARRHGLKLAAWIGSRAASVSSATSWLACERVHCFDSWASELPTSLHPGV